MTNEGAAYEGGGAGGKIRRRPPRRAETPYDRPPTALRNPISDRSSSWLSKLVDPASKIISGSAGRLFSSVFRKRLVGPPSSSETIFEPRHEIPKDTSIIPSEAQEQDSKKGESPSKKIDDNGINELGQLFKQKTFTSVEFNHLSEVLRSRTVDLVAGNENKRTEPSTSQVTTPYVSQEKATISTQDVEEFGSPVELAKAYIANRSSKVSPPLRLWTRRWTQTSGEDATLLNIVPSSLKSPNSPFATRASGRLSTPSQWPRTNGILYTGKQDVEEEAGSPVKLAKAYMGNRSSKVSPPLCLQTRTSREDATSHNIVPSSLKSPNSPSATRASGHSSGLSENGHLTQTPRGRFALLKSAQSPHFKASQTPQGRSALYAGPSTPFQRPRTNGMLSTDKQLKRRRSFLDDDVGALRRIRQRVANLISDSAQGYKSSNPQAAENGDVEILNASWYAVPPQSSEMARKILEEVDKMPLPKEKSYELKLSMARERLTLANLMSMKDVESLKLQNLQDNGSLNGLSGIHLLKSENLVSGKKDKVGEDSYLKNSDLRVTSTSEAGGMDNAIVSLEDIASVAKPVGSIVSSPTAALPEIKRGFKMSAPEEDSLEMDDYDDVYSSKNTSKPPAAEKEKPNPSLSECKTVASETVIIEKPRASPESKPATSFTLNEGADLTARVSDGPNFAEKDVGFTFPTAVPSAPNPPQLISASQLPTSLNPSVLAKEQTGFPQFIFDSKSSDKHPTNFTLSKVGDAFSPNSDAGSDSKLDLLNSNAGTPKTSPVTTPEAMTSDKSDKTQEVGNSYRSLDNPGSSGASTSTMPNIFSFGTSTNSLQSNCLSTSSAISVSSTPTNVTSVTSRDPVFSSSTAATSGTNIPSISATFPTSAPSVFKFGSGTSTDVASSNLVAPSPVSSGLELTGSEAKTKPSLFPDTTSSSLLAASSPLFTSTASSIYGFNSSMSSSTLNSSSAANHSQKSTAFGVISGSIFGTQVASDGSSSFTASTQPMPSQFGSSASASLVGLSGSSIGSAGSSSFASASTFGSTTDGAKLFSSGSGSAFGLSSSSSFSTGGSSFSSSSSLFAPSGTAALFGSSSQPATPSIFSSGFSSSASPPTGFSFGASATPAGSTQPAFGSCLSASKGSLFLLTSSAAATSSSTISPIQPVFGMSNPVGFGSASPGNDQMNVEDSMAEDTVQASTAAAVPPFGQPASTPPSSNFVFGSPAVPLGVALPFQFGAHQNAGTAENPSPFLATGNLEFPPDGSFSLGTGSVDKSHRKIVRVRRDRPRKK